MSANIEKELDFADYDKDEPEESKAAAKAAKKAADSKVAKKADEKDDEKAAHDKAVADVKAKLTTEEKAILLADYMAQQPTQSPLSRTTYDHETKQKNLVKNTAPVRVQMEKLKDDYECVHYMGALCDYWKSLMPLDRAQANEHTCFINYFKKERHLFGLPLYVPASPGSKNVSRGVTPFVNEDEEAGAGAK
jgi:chemotaxis protein histidine kinase CheA